MPPAKKAAPKRAAASTSRTTPSARAAGKVLSFDERRAKVIAERKNGLTEWDAYERTWHIKAPNALISLDFENIDQSQDTTVIVEYLGSHFIPEEREEFLAALYADEDFDWDVLGELLKSITETLAGGLNLPSSPSDD